MEEITRREEGTGKLQVALYTRGTGVILFAFWSFLRAFILSFSGTELMAGTDDLQITTLGIIIVDFIFGGFDAWLRVYVGIRAIAFSRGGKLRTFSLFLAGFFAVVPVLLYALYFKLFGLSVLPLSVMISMIVDAAVIVLNVQIIIFSLRLKKMGT